MKSRSPDASNRSEPKGSKSGSSRRKRNRSAEAAIENYATSQKNEAGAVGGIRTTSVHSGHRLAPQGLSPHRDVESVASLLRRLGTPPPDLAEHLVTQFEEVCRSKLDQGESVSSFDVADWAITSHGELVFIGNETVEHKLSGNLGDWVKRFRQQLSASRATVARRRAHDPSQRFDIAAGRRLDQPETDDFTASGFTDDERIRRQQLIEKFTNSLVDRFGEEVLQPSSEPEEKTRSVKPQAMVRDRRFNWNLVLGVATAAAVIALIWTGFQVNKIRLTRLRNAPRPTQLTEVDNRAAILPDRTEVDPSPVQSSSAQSSSAQSSSAQSSSAQTQSVQSPSVQTRSVQSHSVEPQDRTLPDIDPSELKDLPVSPTSAFADSSENDGAFDVMDELTPLLQDDESLSPIEVPADREQPVEVSIDGDGSDSNLIHRPTRRDSETTAANDSKGATSPPAVSQQDDDSLQSALNADDSQQSPPEAPQTVRPSKDKFVDLPLAGKTDVETVITGPDIAIESIEFLTPSGIRLSQLPDGSSAVLVDQEHGDQLAELAVIDGATVFRWSESAAKNSLSAKLSHGRFVLADGQSVYLRPSIETDPYTLSLDPRRMRPSWKLDAPLLPEFSRLELDLNVPASIDLAWHTPFNSTRPSRGTAIAILTPPDGESVAIAVKIDVDCSRKLTCRTQYGYRLAPSMPWRPLTQAGFVAENQQMNRSRESLLLRRELLGDNYKRAGVMEQRLMRRSVDKLDADIEQMEWLCDQMRDLGELAMEMQNTVSLDMHLYVQWPDSKQTVLKTSLSDREQ